MACCRRGGRIVPSSAWRDGRPPGVMPCNRCKWGVLPWLGDPKGITSLYVSERQADLHVDVLAPVRRAGNEAHASQSKIPLGPLRFLDYLIESPRQAVLPDRAAA
ncbi:MAG: hypothetical protein C4338_05300 [Rhodanobacteraceae bacterium]